MTVHLHAQMSKNIDNSLMPTFHFHFVQNSKVFESKGKYFQMIFLYYISESFKSVVRCWQLKVLQLFSCLVIHSTGLYLIPIVSFKTTRKSSLVDICILCTCVICLHAMGTFLVPVPETRRINLGFTFLCPWTYMCFNLFH